MYDSAYDSKKPMAQGAGRGPALEFRPADDAVTARWWRRILNDLLRPYRPELHYMRGPGPKWREKHEDSDHDARRS